MLVSITAGFVFLTDYSSTTSSQFSSIQELQTSFKELSEKLVMQIEEKEQLKANAERRLNSSKPTLLALEDVKAKHEQAS